MPWIAPVLPYLTAAATAYGISKSASANRQATALSQANADYIKSKFPTSSVLNFPGGNFSFSSTPAFQNSLANASIATPGYRDNDAGDGGGAPWVSGTPGTGIDPGSIGSNYEFNFEGGAEGANNAVFDSISGEFKQIGTDYGGLDLNLDQLTTVNDRIEALLPRVAAGSSQVREAGLNQLGDAEQASSGNLKESLSRRRVLGSSFGNDALSRNEAEFGRKRADFEAQTILQEIDATAKLLDFQKNVATRSAEVLTQQLSGRQRANEGRLATETNRTQLNQAAAIANMQAALQGQAQSMQFIASMVGAINGSTGYVTGSLANQADNYTDVASAALTYGLGTAKTEEEKRADAK